MTIVSGERVVRFEIEEIDGDMVDVLVREGDRSWDFREPAWRDLGIGAAGDGIYWWSARRLVALPPEAGGDLTTLEAEGDEILLVFHLPEQWLLICETSALLISADGETSRFDFPDVVVDAWWEAGALVVEVMDSAPVRLRIDDGHLVVRSRVAPSER